MDIITADEAFNWQMNTYPSVFMAPSVSLARLKYYDHMFNVLGNGYSWEKRFLSEHDRSQIDPLLLVSYPEKYTSGVPLYYAFTEMHNGSPGSCLEEIFTLEETESRADIVCKRLIKNNGEFTPYPNFNKNHSMIWKMRSMGESWDRAALDYYTQMKDFFDGPNVHTYHGAVPKEPVQLNSMVLQYTKTLSTYNSQEDIIKDFNVAYNGDPLEFIERHWEQELHRIHIFLDETIEKLNLSNKSKKVFK